MLAGLCTPVYIHQVVNLTEDGEVAGSEAQLGKYVNTVVLRKPGGCHCDGSPLGLSLHSTIQSQPRCTHSQGRPVWGGFTMLPGSLEPKTLCCPPAPVQDALKALAGVSFSLQAEESTGVLSRPLEGPLPPTRKPPQAQAKASTQTHTSAETALLPEARAAPRPPLQDWWASHGSSERWAGWSIPTSRSGPRA